MSGNGALFSGALFSVLDENAAGAGSHSSVEFRGAFIGAFVRVGAFLRSCRRLRLASNAISISIVSCTGYPLCCG